MKIVEVEVERGKKEEEVKEEILIEKEEVDEGRDGRYRNEVEGKIGQKM